MRLIITTNIREVLRQVENLSARQIPFATSLALTRTAQAIQADVRQDLSQRFVIRRDWISRGIRIRPASKTNLRAEVGSVDPFMARQELGGVKTAKGGGSVSIPLVQGQGGPGGARKTITTVTPPSRWPKAMLSRPGYFVGPTRSGKTGLWQRQGGRGKNARRRIRLMYVFQQGVRVKARWGFRGRAEAMVARRFPGEWAKAMAEAMATAR